MSDLIIRLHDPKLLGQECLRWEAAAEIERLRKFIRMVFDASSWPDGGGVEIDDLQDAAVECGLLTPETRTEPCDPHHCYCAEYYGDMSKGVICFRKADFLLAERLQETQA